MKEKTPGTSGIWLLLLISPNLKLCRDKDSEEILPIRFEDNYFMLLPGELRRVNARYLAADGGTGAPVVSVDCFNNGRS